MDAIEQIRKELPKWASHLLLMNKLTDDFFAFDIFMPDMVIHQFCAYKGRLYKYRQFMSVLNCFKGVSKQRNSRQPPPPENKFVELMLRDGIIEKKYSDHPYYKEKYPRYVWIKGPEYKRLDKKHTRNKNVVA